MTQNMAEIWKEQYRQRFLQEGRQEGLREGVQKGEFDLLSRQLTRRFGELSEAVVTRLKSADSELLALWGERVLEASSLDEVFR
jgi:flagellar biosynthesis/type III secretory pathway protein FliH